MGFIGCLAYIRYLRISRRGPSTLHTRAIDASEWGVAWILPSVGLLIGVCLILQVLASQKIMKYSPYHSTGSVLQILDRMTWGRLVKVWQQGTPLREEFPGAICVGQTIRRDAPPILEKYRRTLR